MANGSDLPMPMQKDERAETFQALADQFQLNMETMDYIKNCKIETLNDLRFFFANESEVATFLDKAQSIPDIELMTSRVRAAWHAIRQQASFGNTTSVHVLAKSDTATLIRPCVDCGRRTGNFCEAECFAADWMPSEAWADAQITPQCTECETKYVLCHYCQSTHVHTSRTQPST